MKTIKIKPGRTGLTALRNKLGFSQELLALYLNVNLSTLKMAEAGHRPLPTVALLKVAELEIRLAARQTQASYEEAHPAEETCPGMLKDHYRQLASKQKKCANECVLLERQLKLMVNNYYKARKRVETIETLIQNDEAGEPRAEAWQVQKEAATHILNRCAKPIQAFLQARINLLHTEIEMYKELTLQAGGSL